MFLRPIDMGRCLAAIESLTVVLLSACGRGTPAVTCPHPGREQLLLASFEDGESTAALSGGFAQVATAQARDGAGVAQLYGQVDGTVRTVVPLQLPNDRVALGFYLRNKTAQGALVVRMSLDGGATFVPAIDAPIGLGVGRMIDWSYSEVSFSVPAGGGSGIFEIAVSALGSGGYAGDPWVELDALQIVDPMSCHAPVEPGLGCDPLNARTLLATSFEDGDPLVAVSGGWLLSSNSSTRTGSWHVALGTGGSGALTVLDDVTPSRTAITVRFWISHGVSSGSRMQLSTSPDGIVFGEPTPVAVDLSARRDAYLLVDAPLPVQPEERIRVRLELVGAWSDTVFGFDLDDLEIIDLGPCAPEDG